MEGIVTGANRVLEASELETRPTQAVGPVTAAERIQTLDVLRGFALLGILLVNMAYFANPVQYAMLPHIAPTALDWGADWLVRFLAEGKFFSLFSFLFGLGFTIQMARAEAKGVRFIPRYLRRAGVLLIFGLLHGLLLWTGDILLYYAILGLLLLFFRHMKFKWVWTWLVVLALLPALFVAVGWMMMTLARQDPQAALAVEESIAEQQQLFQTLGEQAAAIYRNGSYLEVTGQRWRDLQFMWFISLFMAPSIFAMFLLGSIFGRKGYLHHPAEHVQLFRRLLLWGGLVGLVGNALYATVVINSTRIDTTLPMVLAGFGQAIGAPLLMLAYVSAITLGMLNPTWQPRLLLLAPVGRMALTNYLLQSLVCTTIFYGYGLGFFGQMGAAVGFALTLLIYLLQIPWSHWWLARFQVGPVEWLWRTLTYGQRQPFRVAAR